MICDLWDNTKKTKLTKSFLQAATRFMTYLLSLQTTIWSNEKRILTGYQIRQELIIFLHSCTEGWYDKPFFFSNQRASHLWSSFWSFKAVFSHLVMIPTVDLKGKHEMRWDEILCPHKMGNMISWPESYLTSRQTCGRVFTDYNIHV